jgi:hypothetical protein
MQRGIQPLLARELLGGERDELRASLSRLHQLRSAERHPGLLGHPRL